MKRLRENIGFIRKCARTKCRLKFRDLIKKAKPEEIRTLGEAAKNLLLGNIPMTERQKNKLKSFRKQIKSVALKGNSISKKKRLLQRGGSFFIPLLANLAASILSSYLAK